MSGILGRFNKQVGDVLDYDFDYTDWLADRNDTILSYQIVAQAGLTIASTARSYGVCKVYLSGGTNGSTYKVTCTAVTTGGRTKEAELSVRIKEV